MAQVLIVGCLSLVYNTAPPSFSHIAQYINIELNARIVCGVEYKGFEGNNWIQPDNSHQYNKWEGIVEIDKSIHTRVVSVNLF